MAENLLSDARLRTASRERDGVYLPDGGGLRFRLTEPSSKYPRGARLGEFHFKLKRPDSTYLSTSMHVGTIGEAFTDGAGVTRPFTLTDARKARDAARELVSKGIDPREAKRLVQAEAVETQRLRLIELDTRRTVRQAFGKWLELYLAAHRKDGGLYVQALFDKHVLPAIGDQPLEGTKRAQVSDLLDALLAQGLKRTANVTLTSLRQFCRWCLVRDWMTGDPTLGLSKGSIGGHDKPRERTLSSLEVIELRDKLPTAALPERVQHTLWLILASGCRVGEVSAARVEHFDLTARVWHIPETKNGTPHLVHLSGFALAHVRALLTLAGKSAFLLPGRPVEGSDDDRPVSDKFIAKMVGDRQRAVPLKGRSKAVATLVLARGKWTPHDLRRTMATMMRQQLRVSTDVVERCLNHTPQGIVGVYQTGELMDERKEAFEAWGAELERLMRADSTNVTALRVAA